MVNGRRHSGARSLRRVPDAVRHSSCRSAEPGAYQTPEFGTAPALQCTAAQVLRAALRPGRANPANSIYNFKQPAIRILATPASPRFALVSPQMRGDGT